MNNRNHQKQEKHFIVDILFVLALFGVFAVSALALVTIGADVYQHTVEDMGVNSKAGRRCLISWKRCGRTIPLTVFS